MLSSTELNDSVSRLCFGTSTFVAGRLYPRKDSRPGLRALRGAIERGVRFIHSNPHLDTQWAVRHVVNELGNELSMAIRHLIKVEVAPDLDDRSASTTVRKAIEKSYHELGTERLWGVVFEQDLKRCSDKVMLSDESRIMSAYLRGSQLISEFAGPSPLKIAFVQSYKHFEWSRRSRTYQGFAAHFNLLEAWPARILNDLQGQHEMFFAVSPLRRGYLTDDWQSVRMSVPAAEYLRLCRLQLGPSGPLESIALRWAGTHPRVTAVVLGTAQLEHVSAAVKALSERYTLPQFQAVANLWESWPMVRTAKT